MKRNLNHSEQTLFELCKQLDTHGMSEEKTTDYGAVHVEFEEESD